MLGGKQLFRQNKAVVFVLSLLILLLGTLLPGKAAYANEANHLNLEVGAAILIDADTGKVLYEYNADELLGVASMSKMLTEYLVLEAIEAGKISWEDEIIIDEFIHRLSSPYLGLSTVGLTQGESYTIKELFDTMAIHSANASTVALAQEVARVNTGNKSEADFVKMMNEKAAELGLGDGAYHFVNSSGLNNSDMLGNHPEGTDVNDENKMTARAVAKLAYHLLKDYPQVLETAKQPALEFRDGRTYKNFNFMLPGLTFEYPGVDGLKTGYTSYAGYNFTATAERNGQRFISVVMNADSQISRFQETKKLLDYAFTSFGMVELFPANMEIEGYETLPVTKGKEDSVPIATKDPLHLVIKNGEEELYKPKFVLDESKLDENGQLVAPVEKGEVIGYLTYEYEGDDYGFIDSTQVAKVDVVITESVEKANWFVLMMRGIGNFFSNLWGDITSAISGWF